MEAWKVNMLTLLALFLLALVAIPVFSQKIQRDIEEKAQGYLDTERVDWAVVDVDGRDVTLEGAFPEGTSVDSVLNGLRGLEGVRFVFSKVEPELVAQPDETEIEQELPMQPLLVPYRLNAEFDGNRLSLEGAAENSETRDRLIGYTRQVFGADNASMEWKIGDVQPDAWEAAVRMGLAQLARLNKGELSIMDNDIRLEGEAALKDVSDSVNDQMQLLMEDGYSLAFLVDVETPDVETCQTEFRELLRDQRIDFAVGQAEILKESTPLLEGLLDIGRRCSEYMIEVAGHTDSQGGANRNQQLSYSRAQSVIDWLASKGMDVSQMTAVGHGERKPIADNNTKAGRAKNRRIEITVKGS